MLFVCAKAATRVDGLGISRTHRDPMLARRAPSEGLDGEDQRPRQVSRGMSINATVTGRPNKRPRAKGLLTLWPMHGL
jgi:hypothetical protein